MAVKEASGSLGQAMTILSSRDSHLAVLSGEDEMTAPMMLMGAEGVISVVSMWTPRGRSGWWPPRPREMSEPQGVNTIACWN